MIYLLSRSYEEESDLDLDLLLLLWSFKYFEHYFFLRSSVLVPMSKFAAIPTLIILLRTLALFGFPSELNSQCSSIELSPLLLLYGSICVLFIFKILYVALLYNEGIVSDYPHTFYAWVIAKKLSQLRLWCRFRKSVDIYLGLWLHYFIKYRMLICLIIKTHKFKF